MSNRTPKGGITVRNEWAKSHAQRIQNFIEERLYHKYQTPKKRFSEPAGAANRWAMLSYDIIARHIMESQKVMVVGLDGLSLKVLTPLVQQGRLPAFAQLLERGWAGECRSVTNMTTGPTWASFATGCLPARHGILHDFHHQPGSYGLSPTNGSWLRVPTFWEYASEHGAQVIVLNVPMSYPARPVRGVVLAGIDAPSETASGFDYPAGTYKTLRRQTGDYIIDCGPASYIQAGQTEQGLAAVTRETEARTRAAEYFLLNQPWNLFTTVYSLPDAWQHYYWTAETGTPGRKMLEQGYEMVDAHLARLLKFLPDDGWLLVVSDHGFGPLLGTRDHLNRRLAETGFLHYQTGGKPALSGKLIQYFLRQIRKSVSFRTRQQALAAIPALRRFVETRLRIGGIDWSHTQAYAALDHMEIWLNLQGRQPGGIVKPGKAEQILDRLAQSLLDWSHPETKQPYLRAVHRHLYSSVSIPNCLPPDLSLEWDTTVPPARLHPLITGDHTPDGTLIISRKGFTPELSESSLTDIAPIVFHALSLPLPDYLDGRVPQALASQELIQ